ncbi:serine protease [Virgisporangium aliadipatigenens]|uniref:Serine protease n=1 Tax=Virgisporangium aliadipatigenens TaxID=741659 RepID=A0A8J3YFT8_9ACTN|nr:serine protease [Virgisporangium aliadipatigenens]GIJ43622.1 serine protease [Virgisporangium aliadipatigenens]
MSDTVLATELRNRLLDALIDVPGTGDRAGRDALLSGIPANVRASLIRADSQFVDLANLIEQLERLGRLDNGERPVVIVAHNAWRSSRGTDLGRRLMEMKQEVEEAYGREEPLAELTDHPEVLIFGGDGEWVTDAFLRQAAFAGRHVARLLVPRYSGHGRLHPPGLGTGWLVAPQLLITSRHVIVARKKEEPVASDADVQRQAIATEAWFDYHVEGDSSASVGVKEVVSGDSTLDYALLRLDDSPVLADRSQLALARDASLLARGSRLNIVQCPDGSPLKFAIRNNFCVGKGNKPHLLRYLTDTKGGSSGAPVLDDNWQAVAVHRGFKAVDPKYYAGEADRRDVAKYHNEGVLLADILDDLPPAVFQEIAAAQGWD